MMDDDIPMEPTVISGIERSLPTDIVQAQEEISRLRDENAALKAALREREKDLAWLMEGASGAAAEWNHGP